MTCNGYELIALSLGLITAISEALALIKHTECNGILDFIIRVARTRHRCADAFDIENRCELPIMPTSGERVQLRHSF